MSAFVYRSAYISIMDNNVVGAALIKAGVRERDRHSAVAWWLLSEPGESMILVRYGAPHLRIDHDGNVTEVPSPTETRTERAVVWLDEHERMPE